MAEYRRTTIILTPEGEWVVSRFEQKHGFQLETSGRNEITLTYPAHRELVDFDHDNLLVSVRDDARAFRGTLYLAPGHWRGVFTEEFNA